MSLDALKALKEKLKKDVQQSNGTQEKKFVKKGEIEAARLLKIRQEEEEERRKKELKRKQQDGDIDEAEGKVTKKEKTQQQEVLLPDLSREEVIRRLRALGQPATLFGEEDVDRLKRLLKAEKEVHFVDETRGGQQENVLLELQRQGKGKHKGKDANKGSKKDEEDEEVKDGNREKTPVTNSTDQRSGQGTESSKGAVAGPASLPDGASNQANGNGNADDQTMEAFKKAAALLAEKRQEESMAIEDRISKWIKKWMKEWENDLDKRPDAVKATPAGYQATMLFGQTKKYLEPLYERLKHRAMHEEMRAGLWMMVQAMRDRNYLYANDIYLRLAIGNAPWPIGVTSVGIHERSAREKISHAMNQSGQAHIMNDEATRKYLQAVKRMIGAVQRLYPTVPSRSVDFETTADPGRGMSGAGSTKLALLQAEAQGETVEALGLPDAPHFLSHDGSVMVPPKWKNILAKAGVGGDEQPERTASPAPGRSTGSPMAGRNSPALSTLNRGKSPTPP